MRLSRTLSLSMPLLALALGGTALATGSSKVKLAKLSPPNCEINGKKSHYKTKEACEKRKGKWLGDETTNAAAAAPASSSGTTPAAATGTTPPASPKH